MQQRAEFVVWYTAWIDPLCNFEDMAEIRVRSGNRTVVRRPQPKTGSERASQR